MSPYAPTRPMLPRMPPRFARWLTPGENPFTADAEHLHTYAQLVRLAEVDL
jgi:hypothetical protein